MKRQCLSAIFFVAVVSLLGFAPEARAWNQDHHRLIVSDAVDYMMRSGDPMMQEAAYWLDWAPGFNRLLREGGDGWIDPHDCAGRYSALCALRDESANTDWYSDISLSVHPFFAWLRCEAGPLPLENSDIPYSGIVPWCIACLGPALVGVDAFILYSVAFEVAHLFAEHSVSGGVEIDRLGSYNFTSLNHFQNAYYDLDSVTRSPDCEGREQEENLGYLLKNQYYTSCSDDSVEGDCANEFTNLRILSMVGDAWWLKLDATKAANMYEGITCHEHGFSDNATHNIVSRWFPVDSLAEYGMSSFIDGGEDRDLVMVGRALHAVADAFEPHHSYGFMGRGHAAFEAYAEDMLVWNKKLRMLDALVHEDERGMWGDYGFYKYQVVSDYLNLWLLDFDSLLSTESIISGTAKNASTWNHVASQDAPDNNTMAIAHIYGENDTTKRFTYAADHGWGEDGIRLGEMGHNLSVAGTVTLLKKAFEAHYEGWAEANYCSALREQDLVSWLRTVPGPWAGASIPANGANGHFIDLSRNRNARGETFHPYYNAPNNHESNRVIIRVPHEFGGVAELFTDCVELKFSPSCDWHHESEGDHLVISAQYAWGSLGEWETKHDFLYPTDVAGKAFAFCTEPSRRIAHISVDLRQGRLGDKVFAGGEFGNISRLFGEAYEQMDSQSNEVVTGILGNSSADIYASTASTLLDSGSVIHFDGNAGDTWEEIGNFDEGITDIASSGGDIFALGSFSGKVWKYSGTTWTEAYSLGADTYPTGIWIADLDNFFIVSASGAFFHCDRFGCGNLVFDGIPLHGVWGRHSEDVYAVGDGGRLLHYDGMYVNQVSTGITSTLRGVSGNQDRTIAVGDGGVVLQREQQDWHSLESSTTVDLTGVHAQSTGKAFAVGAEHTILYFDGSNWSSAHHEPGMTSLYAVWSHPGGCNPERKFGFKLDEISASLIDRDSGGAGGDFAWVDAAVMDWVNDLLNGGILNGLGIMWDCAQGTPCEDELTTNLTDLFGVAFSVSDYLTTGEIFDIVHTGLLQTLGDDLVGPALSAYALTHTAMGVHPGSLVDSGLGNQAVLWSLGAQGLRSKTKTKADLRKTVSLNFVQPEYSVRATKYLDNGAILPGVQGPDMGGYPGFRSPTEDELADQELAIKYMIDRRKDEKLFQIRKRTDTTLTNLEVLQSILDTNASTDPAILEKVRLLSDAADMAIENLAVFRQQVSDSDSDGIIEGNDDCLGDNSLIGQPCDSLADADDCLTGTWSCLTGALVCLDNDADDDADGDGVFDCDEECHLDPNKTEPGDCGCGVPDVDSDEDGVSDCIDNCPSVANPDQADGNHDGQGDACSEEEPSPEPGESGCGCSSGAPSRGAFVGLLLLGLFGLRRRRRMQ